MILLPNSETKIVYEACVKPKNDAILSEIKSQNNIPLFEYVNYDAFQRKRSYVERLIPFEEAFKLYSDYPSKLYDYDCSFPGLVSTHHTQKVNTYINPLHLAYIEFEKLISPGSCYPLLSLFNKFNRFDRNREIEILEQASDMIKRLQDSSLDNVTVLEIIQKLWPKFGYFTTYFLENIDIYRIETSREYSFQILDDAKRHLRYTEENGIILDGTQRRDFLRKVDIKAEAEDNVKVLSLAKSVNERISSSK